MNTVALRDGYRVPTKPSTPGPFLELQTWIWRGFFVIRPFLLYPENSPICTAFVANALYKILQLPKPREEKTFIRILRTEYHDVMEILIRFVTRSRTDAQLNALEARLTPCHCSIQHPGVSHIQNPPFDEMIAAIFQVLLSMVWNAKVGEVIGASAKSSGGARKWPSSITALFPGGPEASIVCFSQLYKKTKAATILDLITYMFRHSPSLAVVVAENAAFWRATVGALEWAVKTLRTYRRETQPTCDHDSNEIATIKAFSDCVSKFDQTYTSILSFSRTTPSSGFAANAKKIHDLLHDSLLVLNNMPDQKDTRNIVTSIGELVSLCLPPHQRMHWFPTLLDTEPEITRCFANVYASMGPAAHAAHCCSSACSETSESSSQKLRYCGRCRVVRYCSDTCQKEAWKRHKTVCKDLETINKSCHYFRPGHHFIMLQLPNFSRNSSVRLRRLAFLRLVWRRFGQSWRSFSPPVPPLACAAKD
ncbi:hypothetical protein C8J57DRAFT_178686 [Mycena rebaudengoi]|nr:hypothetical protein C8J57DRAFT_178686 [Mycena rebaudengoi]